MDERFRQFAELDDSFMARLEKLRESGFDFNDLLEAERLRAEAIDRVGRVLTAQGTDPFQGVNLPLIRLEPDRVPEFIDGLISRGVSNVPGTVSVAIRLTASLRYIDHAAARTKLQEYLELLSTGDDHDLTLRLVASVCSDELE